MTAKAALGQHRAAKMDSTKLSKAVIAAVWSEASSSQRARSEGGGYFEDDLQTSA